jgi:CheY-like chemotaxis protein
VRNDARVPRSVLIVDDSAPFRTTARALLQARGYAVAGTAADGAQALDAAATLRPDAVLLDVNLPDMDGMTVAERLTMNGHGRAVPAVVLVSTVERAALGSAVDTCGARGFLAKSDLASPRLVALLGPPDA